MNTRKRKRFRAPENFAALLRSASFISIALSILILIPESNISAISYDELIKIRVPAIGSKGEEKRKTKSNQAHFHTTAIPSNTFSCDPSAPLARPVTNLLRPPPGRSAPTKLKESSAIAPSSLRCGLGKQQFYQEQDIGGHRNHGERRKEVAQGAENEDSDPVENDELGKWSWIGKSPWRQITARLPASRPDDHRWSGRE